MAKCKYDSMVQPYLETIRGWVRNGVPEKMIYEKLGISRDSFYKYKRDIPEFSEALAQGKEICDLALEGAYYKRAFGYDTEEKAEEYKYIYKHDGTCEKRLVSQKIFTKHVAGDPRAAEHWLELRQPERWKRTPDYDPEKAQSFGVVIIPERAPEPTPPEDQEGNKVEKL